MTEQAERFRRRVEELVSRFESMAGPEWKTRRYPKKFRDEGHQLYEAPALYLQKGPISLLLDPIGEDRGSQRRAVGEPSIDGADAHPRRARDLIEPDLQAALGEEFTGGVEHQAPGALRILAERSTRRRGSGGHVVETSKWSRPSG